MWEHEYKYLYSSNECDFERHKLGKNIEHYKKAKRVSILDFEWSMELLNVVEYTGATII